jgi:hypothetical protein
MSRGTKCANAEPAKTNIETPRPSPRKAIIRTDAPLEKVHDAHKKDDPAVGASPKVVDREKAKDCA